MSGHCDVITPLYRVREKVRPKDMYTPVDRYVLCLFIMNQQSES